jgi:hypothetical protein
VSSFVTSTKIYNRHIGCFCYHSDEGKPFAGVSNNQVWVNRIKEGIVDKSFVDGLVDAVESLRDLEPYYPELEVKESVDKFAAESHNDFVRVNKRVSDIQNDLVAAREKAARDLKRANRIQIIRDVIMTLAGVVVAVGAGLILHYCFGIG